MYVIVVAACYSIIPNNYPLFLSIFCTAIEYTFSQTLVGCSRWIVPSPSCFRATDWRHLDGVDGCEPDEDQHILNNKALANRHRQHQHRDGTRYISFLAI